MNKLVAIIGLAFVVVGALAMSMAPDVLAMAVVGLMLITVTLGYIFGLLPTALYAGGFRRGRATILEIQDTQSASPWVTAQQTEYFFHQRTLDGMFLMYVEKTRQQSREGLTPADLEDVINDYSLALRSWQAVVQQIPGTLTALGLLGTFIGLITGISSIGFSSVEAALGSIEVLLGGIQTAFFTSIVGVILSIMFNMLYKLVWNMMLREMGFFMEQFHMFILPSLEEQNRVRANLEMKQLLEKLDRLPRDRGYGGDGQQEESVPLNDQNMMPEIRDGLKNGEFTFYVEPRCALNTRKIVAGEALVRWNNPDMGVVTPAAFMPLVERNGFSVRINQYVWELVCQSLRRWIDMGKRPVPISVNVSKSDIQALDVAGFFAGMIHKYRIPPRYLEMEISQSAYVQCENLAQELEGHLRQMGFHVIADGYNGNLSEMKALRQCDADAVKLDLSLLRDRSPEALRAVMEQSQSLNRPIVVSGIENTEQLTTLRRCGCSEGQGYYFHRPMPIEDFEVKMRSGAGHEQVVEK